MQLYAIIGEHLEHTASPTIHAYAFARHTIRATYKKLEITAQDFDNTIRALKSNEHYAGFNITIPYKSSIIAYVDHLDQTAQHTGAVNTIKPENGKWIGFNTDVSGFKQPLMRSGHTIKRSLILGGGGAARAVIYGLLQLPDMQSITICMRNQVKGRQLHKDFKPVTGNVRLKIDAFESAADLYPEHDLLVNTTPVGMYPHQDARPLRFRKNLKKPLVVYDLVYNPSKTIFLRDAQQLSELVKIISGVDMLIGQAAESFTIWTGLDFPVAEARELLLKTIQQ